MEIPVSSPHGSDKRHHLHNHCHVFSGELEQWTILMIYIKLFHLCSKLC